MDFPRCQYKRGYNQTIKDLVIEVFPIAVLNLLFNIIFVVLRILFSVMLSSLGKILFKVSQIALAKAIRRLIYWLWTVFFAQWMEGLCFARHFLLSISKLFVFRLFVCVSIFARLTIFNAWCFCEVFFCFSSPVVFSVAYSIPVEKLFLSSGCIFSVLNLISNAEPTVINLFKFNKMMLPIRQRLWTGFCRLGRIVFLWAG